MKILFLTNEYPPLIYGGAGIHADYLSRELAKLCQVNVRCFGNQKLERASLLVTGFPLNKNNYDSPKPLHSIFSAAQRCLDFNAHNIDADLVHCHTWYTHLGGILAKLNYSIPLVITTHSLEPLRPWKREQLAGGYDYSCWVEKTALEMADAVIAVSREAKNDILKFYKVDPKKIHVIHNGIDLNEYKRTESPKKLKAFGIDPAQPYVLFVGRITRQKGIIHLVRAIRHMDKGFQIVLCAGAPDTPEIAKEMQAHVAKVQKERPGVVWIQEMVDVPTKVALYSKAAAFVCPSIYEPFGIINLEAMACEVPVVASAVGGIKEVVVQGVTGLLVSVGKQNSRTFEPLEPVKFEKALARKINQLMKDQTLSRKMGRAGRKRAIEQFSWTSIAKKTNSLYRSLLSQ